MLEKLKSLFVTVESDILDEILTAKAKTLNLFQIVIDELVEIDSRLHSEATRLQTESLVITNKLEIIAQEKSKIKKNLDTLQALI